MENQARAAPQQYIQDWCNAAIPNGEDFNLLNLSEALSPWLHGESDSGTSNYLPQNDVISPHWPQIDTEAALQPGSKNFDFSVCSNASIDNHQACASSATSDAGITTECFLPTEKNHVMTRSPQKPNSPTISFSGAGINIPLSGQQFLCDDFSRTCCFGSNVEHNHVKNFSALAPEVIRIGDQTCLDEVHVSNQKNLRKPRYMPILDGDGLITIKADQQTLIPELAEPASSASHNIVDESTQQSNLWGTAKQNQLGYLQHAFSSFRGYAVNDTKPTESREKLVRQRATGLDSIIYKVEHKCRECNISFLSGNALGGHMSSHSKKRKLEATAK